MAFGLHDGEAFGDPAHGLEREPGIWPMVRVLSQTARDQALAQSSTGPSRAMLSLAVASMLGGFVAGYFGWPSACLHLLGLYLLAEWLLPRLRAAEADSSVPPRMVRVTLTPDLVWVDEIESGNASSGSCHRWQELRGCRRFPQHRLLLVPDREPVLVPCSLFSKRQLAALDAVLSSRVMQLSTGYMPRLRPVLIGAALAGAFIWELFGRPLPW